MRVGGRRKLTIPSAMAYGARGAGGVIKPHEPLVFVVDLLSVDLGPDSVLRNASSGIEVLFFRRSGWSSVRPTRECGARVVVPEDLVERREATVCM